VPDRRRHRGAHPEDERLFAPEVHPVLREATADLCWLLSRGYAHESSLKLVGDRYALVARQRVAVARCACSDAAAARRRERQVDAGHVAGRLLYLDGYNVLTTIEAALAGGVLLAGRDGALRDMASMHGSYRKVAETVPALELLGEALATLGAAECRWLLDRPVSNSGRLKAIIEELAAARGWPWRVELVPDPDTILADLAVEAGEERLGCATASTGAVAHLPTAVVATADSAILDAGPAWFNLAREVVARCGPAKVQKGTFYFSEHR
jgi:hypothetical protein